MQNNIILPPIGPKSEKKSFPVPISKMQRKGLSDIWVCTKHTSSNLVEKGLDNFDPTYTGTNSEEPFSEILNLTAKLETIKKLDQLAENSGLAKAEIVRRIIDKFTYAWGRQDENYRKMKKPFDALLSSTTPSNTQE